MFGLEPITVLMGMKYVLLLGVVMCPTLTDGGTDSLIQSKFALEKNGSPKRTQDAYFLLVHKKLCITVLCITLCITVHNVNM